MNIFIREFFWILLKVRLYSWRKTKSKAVPIGFQFTVNPNKNDDTYQIQNPTDVIMKSALYQMFSSRSHSHLFKLNSQKIEKRDSQNVQQKQKTAETYQDVINNSLSALAQDPDILAGTDSSAIANKIIVARVSLLLKHPFFGNLATRLQIKEGTEWLPTAATDGRFIYFNREFFEFE